MVIKDEKKFFYEVDSDKIFVTRILRRDLFAVANLLVCDFAMWLRPNFFMIMGSKKKGDSIYMCNGYCNMTKNCSCIHEIMLYFTQIYSLAHSIKFSPIRSLYTTQFFRLLSAVLQSGPISWQHIYVSSAFVTVVLLTKFGQASCYVSSSPVTGNLPVSYL